MQQLGEPLISRGGRGLCYGLIANQMRVEDSPSCGGEVSALPQVRDDHPVQDVVCTPEGSSSSWGRTPNIAHTAQPAEFCPPSSRDQIGEHAGVPIEMGHAQAPV